MTNIPCPICGGQNSTQIGPNQYRCEYCGHIFTPQTNTPQRTPQYAPQNNAYGFSQNPYNAPVINNGKNRTTADSIALFLGGLGGHHFYLGHTLMGVLCILLCWTYIPAILGIIEGVMLLSQTDEEFAVKPKLLLENYG